MAKHFNVMQGMNLKIKNSPWLLSLQFLWPEKGSGGLSMCLYCMGWEQGQVSLRGGSTLTKNEQATT